MEISLTGNDTYLIDGDEYHRVTNVCKWAGDPAGLIRWAAENGADYCDQVRDSSSKIGLATHIMCAGKPFPQELSLYEDAAKQRINWLRIFEAESGWAPTETEKTVHSKTLKIAGTLDAVGSFRGEFLRKYGFTDDGKPWIIDYKTGRLKQQHALQLLAYGLLFSEMNAHSPIPFEIAYQDLKVPFGVTQKFHYGVILLDESGCVFRPLEDAAAETAAQCFLHRFFDYQKCRSLTPFISLKKTGYRLLKGL